MTNPIERYGIAANEAIDHLEAALAAIREWVEPVHADQAQVHVPGVLLAHYCDGVITHWVFTPSEADAGYFGLGSSVVDGDDLDVKDQDGPFWTAVRTDLESGKGTFRANWEC